MVKNLKKCNQIAWTEVEIQKGFLYFQTNFVVVLVSNLQQVLQSSLLDCRNIRLLMQYESEEIVSFSSNYNQALQRMHMRLNLVVFSPL
jgi:hypothetical protein